MPVMYARDGPSHELCDFAFDKGLGTTTTLPTRTFWLISRKAFGLRNVLKVVDRSGTTRLTEEIFQTHRKITVNKIGVHLQRELGDLHPFVSMV